MADTRALLDTHRPTVQALLRDFRPQREVLEGYVWVCLFDADMRRAHFLWTQWKARELLALPIPLDELRAAGKGRAGALVVVSSGSEVTGHQVAAEFVPQEEVPEAPEWLALGKPRYLAAGNVFQALQVLSSGSASDHDPVARNLLFSALQRLTPGLGNPETLGAPRRAAAPWVAEVLDLPGSDTEIRITAAFLVMTALYQLGDYPEDAPDYDRCARDELLAALLRLRPDMLAAEGLGLPRPAARPAPEDRGPAWVGEVLAEKGQGGGHG